MSLAILQRQIDQWQTMIQQLASRPLPEDQEEAVFTTIADTAKKLIIESQGLFAQIPLSVFRPIEENPLSTSLSSSFNLREIRQAKIIQLLQEGHHPKLAKRLVDNLIKRGETDIARLEQFSKFKKLTPQYKSSIYQKLLELSDFFKIPLKNLFLALNAGIEFDEEFLKFSFSRSKETSLFQYLSTYLIKNHFSDLKENIYRFYDLFLFCTEAPSELYKLCLTMAAAAGMSAEILIQDRLKYKDPLENYFINKIKDKGRVTYAEYINMVLYDHQQGFYTRPRDIDIVGGFSVRTEFKTSPEKLEEFGHGIAFDLYDRWMNLGCPEEFQVIEMGAGHGTLAKTIFQLIFSQDKPEWKKFASALQYKIVEISSELIKKQKETLSEFLPQVEWIPTSALELEKHFTKNSITGVFLSNELPDAFPVHIVKKVDGKLREVFLEVRDDTLCEVTGDLSTPLLQEFINQNKIDLAEGEVTNINLNAVKWIKDCASFLKEGDILTFDYGYTAETRAWLNCEAPPLQTYGAKKHDEILEILGIKKSSSALEKIKSIEKILDRTQDLQGLTQLVSLYGEKLMGKINEDVFYEWALKILHNNGLYRFICLITHEAWNSALCFPGNFDITTQVNFSSLENEIIQLSEPLEKTFFGTQETYFKSISEKHPFHTPPHFFEHMHKQQVQIFSKRKINKRLTRLNPLHSK